MTFKIKALGILAISASVAALVATGAQAHEKKKKTFDNSYAASAAIGGGTGSVQTWATPKYKKVYKHGHVHYVPVDPTGSATATGVATGAGKANAKAKTRDVSTDANTSGSAGIVLDSSGDWNASGAMMGGGFGTSYAHNQTESSDNTARTTSFSGGMAAGAVSGNASAGAVGSGSAGGSASSNSNGTGANAGAAGSGSAGVSSSNGGSASAAGGGGGASSSSSSRH